MEEEMAAATRITVALTFDKLVKLEAATATLAKMTEKAGTKAVLAQRKWLGLYRSLPETLREPVSVGREDSRLRLIRDDARRRAEELSLAADILRLVLAAVYSKEG